MNSVQLAANNKATIVAGASASLLSATVILFLYDLAGPVIAVAITPLPSALLALYVTRRPTVQNRSVLFSALIIGTIAVLVNAIYMSSDSCTADAMCALNIVNAPLVQLLSFVVLRVIFSAARRR